MYKYLMAIITILILSIVIIILTHLNKNEEAIQIIDKEGATIETSLIVDKKAVIDKLSSVGEISGLKVDLNKTIPYEDYNTKDWLKKIEKTSFIKKLSKRNLTLNTTATVKLGYDIYDIDEKDITIDKSVIYIKSPKIKILSTEIHLDTLTLNEHVSMLGEKFTEEDKKVMYVLAEEKIKENVMNDSQLIRQAELATQQAILDLLSIIPGVQEVKFIN